MDSRLSLVALRAGVVGFSNPSNVWNIVYEKVIGNQILHRLTTRWSLNRRHEDIVYCIRKAEWSITEIRQDIRIQKIKKEKGPKRTNPKEIVKNSLIRLISPHFLLSPVHPHESDWLAGLITIN